MTKTTSASDETTLNDIVLRMRQRDSAQIAVHYKPSIGAAGEKPTWQTLSWAQYYSQIESFGLGLLEMGLKTGDKVAIFANTRLQWCVSDYAIMGVGGVVVPIYQTVTAEDLLHILTNSQTRILILENKALWKVFETIQGRCPNVEVIVIMDPFKDQPQSLRSFQSVQQSGLERLSRAHEEFPQACRKARPDDRATILYTSGTTGLPKGVVLSHRQGVSEIHDAFHYVGVTTDDICLTFLPYAHILGRLEHWGQAYCGFQIAFAESIDRLKSNLAEIRPTIMVAVPRIFEKFYAAIWAQAESNFLSNRLFRWSLAVGLKVGDYRLRHESIPVSLLAEFKLADQLALRNVRNLMGGRLRFAISGGAPLARDIALFFHACGILILEGYGLTETTGAITVNAPFDYRFGSVGKPFGDVQLKFAEDGEILVHSAKVMQSYYNNPEETAAAITEGWFHTGDIGELTATGDLRITDRKKDLIKTAGGKYVAPQRLENLLKKHSLISQVLIHGDQRKYIVALITLDRGAILNIAKEQKLATTDYAELTQNNGILELVRKAIAETNTHLSSFESIKRFTVLTRDFTVEAGELTPSLKIKRKVLDQKFKREIDSLYK